MARCCMARRVRRNEAVLERTASLVLTTAPGKKTKVRIPRKKGKPVTKEAIAKYLKIKALYESAKALGNEGEAKAAQARLDGMAETYPGIARKAAAAAKDKKGKTTSEPERQRPSYTESAAAEAMENIANEATEAVKALRTHKVVISYPNGETLTVDGYASRRAANIDAKRLVLEAKRVFEAELGIMEEELPVKVEYDKDNEESGYRWGDVIGKPSEALRRNPRKISRNPGKIHRNTRKIRHNTHLPVGTSVDYKGKAAKVIAQHERDHYTIRFASTGKTMRVPGFILVRR